MMATCSRTAPGGGTHIAPARNRCRAGAARRVLLTLLVLLVASAPAHAGSERVRTPHVEATLLSEVSRVAPHSGFWVGLRLEIEPGWHTYWRNPGDSGLAARIDWELPEGMVAGEIRWPVPHRFRIGDLMNYGYADGVVWLSVISSAPGAQGHVSPEKANALTRERDASPTAVLMDPEGHVGKLYGARTTPHMYIVDPEGVLVYKGGIDDKPSTRRSDIDTAKNYVRVALTEAKAGKPVSEPVTRPYGCSVKYAY